MARNRNLGRILGALTGQPWLIREGALHEMIQLAQRVPINLVELASRDGVTVKAFDQEDEADEALERRPPYALVDGVAIIEICGPIFAYASWLDDLCGASSYERIEAALVEALNDQRVKAIVLKIDSPGGEVTGCSELAAFVRDSRAVKPIVAYAYGNCASAAYWLASASSHIVASTTSAVGCLGCCGTIRDTRKAEEAAGVKTYEIVSSQTPKKRPDIATDEGRAQIQGMIDATADVFLADVAANRGVGIEVVNDNFGQGDVLVGQHAVKAGLADEIGSLDDVISALAEAA